MSKDRFPELNEVLDACVAEVKERVAEYVNNQNRIHNDKSQARFSTLSDAQVGAMAKEAIAARQDALGRAMSESIVAECIARVPAESRG